MSAGSKFNLLGIQKLFLWNLVPILDEIKNVSKQTTIRVEGENHLLTLFVVLNLVIAERLYKHKTYFQFVGWQNELQKIKLNQKLQQLLSFAGRQHIRTAPQSQLPKDPTLPD